MCGGLHTIVLTENEKVYTFGYGGKQTNFIFRLFRNYAGALGHDAQKSISRPKMVKALENENIERITTGTKFNTAINGEGLVYYWGNGEYGVFGDGSNRNELTPRTS